MKFGFYRFVFASAMSVCVLCGSAQDIIKVEGQVVDEGGAPLLGVTVSIEGATQGTITGYDGAFSLEAESGSMVVFAMVGMKISRLVAGDEPMTVTLEEETEVLNAVVVDGFRQVERRLFTGASENLRLDNLPAKGIVIARIIVVIFLI